MEDRPKSRNQKDLDAERPLQPAAPPRESFMETWHRFLTRESMDKKDKPEELDDEEDDDEEEETLPDGRKVRKRPLRRLGALLRRSFMASPAKADSGEPKTTEPQQEPEPQPPAESPLELPPIDNRPLAEQGPADTVHLQRESEAPQEAVWYPHLDASEPPDGETAENPPAEAADEPAETIGETAGAKREALPEPPAAEDGGNRPLRPPRGPEATEPPEESPETEPEPVAYGGGGYASPDFLQAPRPSTVERRIDSHKGAAAAFIIADQLSRHRDRKLRREDRAIRRDLGRLDERVKSTQQQKQQVEELQRRVREQAEKLREARMPAPEKVFQKQEVKQPAGTFAASERKPMSPYSTTEQIARREPPAAKPAFEARHEPLIARAEKYVPPSYDRLKPEEVLKKVEVAAEKNLPVEIVYERRHEVKDEPAQLAGQRAGGLSFSPTLSNAPLPPPPVPPPPMHTQPPMPLPPNEPMPLNEPSLYKHAVAGGAGAALVILAVLLVIWLLS